MPLDELDPSRSALVLVDLQRGVVGRSVGPHSADDVVASSVRLAQAFRDAGALVVLVRVSFAADFADALHGATDEPSGVCERPEGWDQVVDEVAALGDVVVTKRQWGAFHGTDLDVQLRRRGLDTVVLGGIATNMGVESTARAAHEHGYHVVLVEDAMSGLSAEDHAFAIERIFPRLGRVTATDEAIAALGGG